MSRQSIAALAVVLQWLTADRANARFHRVGQIPNGNINSCSNCHINPRGGGTRNTFGQAVEAGLIGPNVDWGPALAALDSDGELLWGGTTTIWAGFNLRHVAEVCPCPTM